MYWIGFILCYFFCLFLLRKNDQWNKYIVAFFLSASSWVGLGICFLVSLSFWMWGERNKLVDDLEENL